VPRNSLRQMGIRSGQKGKPPSQRAGRRLGGLKTLAPRDEQNTYCSPGEIAGSRFLRCKQRGCAKYLIGTELAAAGGCRTGGENQEGSILEGQTGRAEGEDAGNLASHVGRVIGVGAERDVGSDRIFLNSAFAAEPKGTPNLSATSGFARATVRRLMHEAALEADDRGRSCIHDHPMIRIKGV